MYHSRKSSIGLIIDQLQFGFPRHQITFKKRFVCIKCFIPFNNSVSNFFVQSVIPIHNSTMVAEWSNLINMFVVHN